MKIGYGKLCRSWNLDPKKWSAVGGDVDVWRLLQRLALARPDDEFILVGRNTGENPVDVGLPANVTNPWSGDRRKNIPVISSITHKNELGKSVYDTAGALTIVHAYDELTGSLFDDLDQIIVWAGQHGSTMAPLPVIGGKDWSLCTQPQVSQLAYGSYMLRGINRWRSQDNGAREEIWLCPDPRNYLKCRDLKWPLRHPVLAQYTQRRNLKHERYGDPRTPEELGFNARPEDTLWVAQADYAYSGLELTALEEPSQIPFNLNWDERADFGIMINENRKGGKKSRLPIVQEWIDAFYPYCEIIGSWTQESQDALGRIIDTIRPLEVYDAMGRWKTTFTTPASSSGWATAKPWEAFACGTICFFHPDYDTQGHIIPTLKNKSLDPNITAMVEWLRLRKPSDLMKRVTAISRDRETCEWLARAQRDWFEKKYGEQLIMKMINERLDECN